MAKIAVDSAQAVARRRTRAEPGRVEARRIASGDGWTVEDVTCTSGPRDRPYDEAHDHVAIAIVTSGTFQYRAAGTSGRELMTPGSVLLGSPGQCFECGHEHGIGDRCLSFRFTSRYFDTIAADADAATSGRRFRALRLPPVQALSPVIADACAALAGDVDVDWEELGVRLAARVMQIDGNTTPDVTAVTPAAIARVTQVVRLIDERPTADLTLVRLAREAGLSPFHFLRLFESVTGVTPHQYLMRVRLRAAATRLAAEAAPVIDIALDAGFGDVSNFNRAFRREFAASPTGYRRRFRR